MPATKYEIPDAKIVIAKVTPVQEEAYAEIMNEIAKALTTTTNGVTVVKVPTRELSRAVCDQIRTDLQNKGYKSVQFFDDWCHSSKISGDAVPAVRVVISIDDFRVVGWRFPRADEIFPDAKEQKQGTA
ncbi:MAG: hypothetical protein KGL39_52050 [Patescibacteria group bacterium]|nr:hypothetical protein [Patescibacteria group bacterium]